MAPSSSLISFLLFFTLITLTTKPSSSSPIPPTLPPSTNPSTDFIKTRCQSTLYPSLCVASLSSYASSIQQDPVRLARTSAKLSTSQLHSAAYRVTSYLHTTKNSTTPRTASALKDCVSTLRDAADQTWQSASEIGKLDGGGMVGPQVAWRVSNAQTWMSAALTNEETCTDGMAEVEEAEGRVKVDVVGRVGRAKQYTSISLALVNSLVNGRR